MMFCREAQTDVDMEADNCHTILCATGDVAQLGERCLRKAEAEGSNPFISTTTFPALDIQGRLHLEPHDALA